MSYENMHKLYPYFKAGKANSVEKAFTSEEIANMLVVHVNSSSGRGYKLFYSPFELYHFIRFLPENDRDLYEVATEFHRQKLRFDVDSSVGKLRSAYNSIDCLRTLINKFEDDCYTYVCSSISKVWRETHNNVPPPPFNVDVYSSHSTRLTETNEGITHEKVSLHIVADVYGDYKLMKIIGNKIIDYLPENIKPMFDRSVYKKTQNFRLYGCSKKTQGRFKRKITNIIMQRKYPNLNMEIENYDNLTFKQINDDIYNNLQRYSSLLTVIGPNCYDWCGNGKTNVMSDVIISDNDNMVSNTTTLESVLGCKKIKVIVDMLSKLGLSYFSGRLNRFKKGYCHICKKEHENDNGYLFVNDRSNSIDISLGCFRSVQYVKNSDRKTYLLKSFRKNTDISKLAEEVVTTNTQNISTIEINDRYIDHNLLHQCLNNNSLVAVKSGTGSGKSYALKQTIQNILSQSGNEPSFIILTYRRSLAKEYYKKYKELGFEIYDLLNGKINSNRLIIQIESLHRLDLGNLISYDYLILDECNKTIEQFNSSFISNVMLTKTVIKQLIKEAKNIVMLDAFLNYNSILGLLSLRYDKNMNKEPKLVHSVSNINDSLYINEEKLLILINSFTHKTRRKHNIIHDYIALIIKLIHSIKDDKKIAIACNSKKQSKLLYFVILHITEQLKLTKTVGLYTGDSSNITKDSLKNINEEWKKDIVIYTSVVEAGNSFDENWFDELYCYFTNKATNYLGCMQMMDRVRTIKSNNVYIFIKDNNIPTLSLKQVEERMKTIKYAYDNNVFDSLVLFELNGKKLEYNNTDPFYSIFVRNKALDEYSKGNFRKLLYKCWITTGAQIFEWNNDEQPEHITNTIRSVYSSKSISDNDYLYVKKLVNVIKLNIKENTINGILSSNLSILTEHILEYRDCVDDSNQEQDDKDNTITPEDIQNAQIKESILTTYKLDEKQLTKEIIDKYGCPKKLISYQNYRELKKYRRDYGNKFLDEYRKNMLRNMNISEFSSLNSVYKNTHNLEILLRLDTLNIMYSDKIDDVFGGKEVLIPRTDIENKVKVTLEYIRDTHAKKLNLTTKLTKVLNSKNSGPKIRFINDLTETLMGVKIKLRHPRSGNYIVVVTNYQKVI